MKNPFSLNPVALRELRQLVRSRVITWSFALYPAILFGFTMLAVATAMGKRSAEDIAFGSGIGEGPFTMVAVITGVVACLGIPFYAAMKAILDTNRNGPGLEFTTALTPANIVGGRLVSTAILIASAVATAMPFFIFAYLLRGITLEQVFLTPLALFGYAIAMFSLSLVIACRPVAVPLRVIMTVGLFFAMTFVVPGIVTAVSVSHRHFGGAAPVEEPSYIASILGYAAILAALVLFVRAFCASQLAPRYVDADRPFRRVYLPRNPESREVECPAQLIRPPLLVPVRDRRRAGDALRRDHNRRRRRNVLRARDGERPLPDSLGRSRRADMRPGDRGRDTAQQEMRRQALPTRHRPLHRLHHRRLHPLVHGGNRRNRGRPRGDASVVAEKPAAHLTSYGLLLLFSLCVIVISSVRAFRTYRRPK